MKKALASILSICMMICCFAGCTATTDDPKADPKTTAPATADGGKTTSTSANTIYFLTPTATHGWMGQLGAFAAQKVEEINKAGVYKAYHYTADAGSVQNDQIDQIIANGDAVGAVICAFDDDAASGEMALTDANIPWISVSRIIDTTMQYALVNISGNNASCGALCAAWMTERGFAPGDTLVQFTGSTNTDATMRSNGFYDFLTGAQNVTMVDGSTISITDVYDRAWTAEEVDTLKNSNNYFNYVCDWSNDVAKTYIESDLQTWVTSAENNGGKLFINSHDDEMTMALLESLESNIFDDGLKARFADLDVYCTAVGGMQELYDVMAGKSSTLSPIRDTYFDDLMSSVFNPSIVMEATDLMLQYLDDPGSFPLEVGSEYYPDSEYVDSSNADTAIGFTGRGG